VSTCTDASTATDALVKIETDVILCIGNITFVTAVIAEPDRTVADTFVAVDTLFSVDVDNVGELFHRTLIVAVFLALAIVPSGGQEDYKVPFFVIPAKAGTREMGLKYLVKILAFAGMMEMPHQLAYVRRSY
jgi:hypothetical protein